jgi:hypothetical protein
LDACLGGGVLASALREAGATVISHDDVFPQGTPDEVWLREAGIRGWLVLTKDDKIRYRAITIEAMRRFSVRAFVLTGKTLTGSQMAEAFVKALPDIWRLARSPALPVIARVTASGSVRRLR